MTSLPTVSFTGTTLKISMGSNSLPLSSNLQTDTSISEYDANSQINAPVSNTSINVSSATDCAVSSKSKSSFDSFYLFTPLPEKSKDAINRSNTSTDLLETYGLNKILSQFSHHDSDTSTYLQSREIPYNTRSRMGLKMENKSMLVAESVNPLVGENLSSFLPHIASNVDVPAGPEGSSLRGLLERPLVTKELTNLPSHSLSGFRLYPGALPEAYRIANLHRTAVMSNRPAIGGFSNEKQGDNSSGMSFITKVVRENTSVSPHIRNQLQKQLDALKSAKLSSSTSPPLHPTTVTDKTTNINVSDSPSKELSSSKNITSKNLKNNVVPSLDAEKQNVSPNGNISKKNLVTESNLTVTLNDDKNKTINSIQIDSLKPIDNTNQYSIFKTASANNAAIIQPSNVNGASSSSGKKKKKKRSHDELTEEEREKKRRRKERKRQKRKERELQKQQQRKSQKQEQQENQASLVEKSI